MVYGIDRLKVKCSECKHLRTAPHQSRNTGCYHRKYVKHFNEAWYLDEQQVGGDYIKINWKGDCAEYEPIPKKPTFWERLF